LREYSDRVTDLGVPTPSGIGNITIEREYRHRRWRMRAASQLDVIRDTAAGIIPVVDDAYYYPGDMPRLAMPEVGDDGTTPVRHTLDELPTGVYRSAGNRIEKKADGTLTWDNGYGATREYDAQGRHVATYIRSMLKATYAYDADGALQNIKDANGRTIYTFATTTAQNGAQTVTVTDLAGRTVTYQWQNGLLMAVTDVMGRTTAYEYGAYGEIIKKVEPAGRTYAYRWQVDVEDGVALEEPVNLHYLPVQVVWMRSPDGQTRTFNWIYDKVADEYHVSMRTNTGDQTDSVISANSTLLSQSVNGVRVYAYQAQVGEASAAIEFTANGNTRHEELDSQDRLISRTYSDDTTESWTYVGASKIPVTHTGRDGLTEKWEYDAAGRMTAHIEAVGTPYERSLRHEYYPGTSLLKTRTDALGRETTYVYDANGLRIETTEPGGVKTTYTRDALGRVTGMTDALGRTWQYQHDAEGRVIVETNPLGVKTLYTYDAAGNLTREETGKFEDQPGRMTTHEYDSGNRHTATYREDAQGVPHLVSATTYDAAGRVASTRDALGVTAIYAYDNQSRPASITRPTPGGGQIETRTTYDAQGNPTEVRQVLVQAGTGEENTVMPATVRYVYDSEGRELVRMEAPDTPLERHTETIYDGSGRVKSTTIRAIGSGWGSDATTRTETYTYDALGRRASVHINGELTGSVPTYDTLERVLSETDALGNVTAYTYDDADRVTETKLNGRTISTVTYNAIGQPVATADALGNHMHTRHDDLGRTTHQSITFAHGETAPDNWWTQPKYVLNETIYNVHGEAVTQKRPTVAPDNTVTYATADTIYDDLGRVGATIAPTGLAQQYHYDNAGRMIQVTRPAADGTTLQVGESTEHHPTLSGIVLAQVDATGERTEYTYDALGRAIAIKTPLGGTVTNTYDALGRVTKSETRDASNTVVASTSMTYNHFDQPLVTTHADGSTEVNTYDASGRLIEKGGNAAYSLRYTYDALGRMATMTDGNNSTTAWAYNDLGQVEAKTYADGSVWRYTYTDTGQLATRTWARTRADGQPLVTTYAYTPSGQLASVSYNDGTTPSVAFTYDQQGRRLSMTTGSTPGSAGISARDAITTNSIYDPAGHLMTIDDGTNTLAYTYNPHSQRLSMSVSGTSSSTLNLNYNYDAAGRLTTIANDDQTHRYTYHPGTRQLATRTSGNVTTTYAYDTGQGMLTSIENKAGATIVSKYAYTINNRGQRTQVSQTGAAFATPSGYGWLYNTKGEVVAANHTADTTKNRAYNYDPIGNRRWSTEGNPRANASKCQNGQICNLLIYNEIQLYNL
jgi:YD repeat-containing protein